MTPDIGPWGADVLGDQYQQRTIHLAADPDGEGDLDAVLVRRADGAAADSVTAGAVLYVHGYSDYFFQTDLAERFAARGFAFYALDLRKCGRSRRPGQTPHYVSDLALYDEELEASLQVITDEHPNARVIVVGHSTGGLVLPLWLDRRRRDGRVAPVAGVALNSPWFDLQGKPVMRGPVTWALRGVSRVQPLRTLRLPPSTLYGDSLHVSGSGEWEFDTELKPLGGFPVSIGWLNAVRRGQAALHRGLDVGVPSLVLRSDKTYYSSTHSERTDRADIVLDVAQIARWSGCLGGATTVVPVVDARHDVFLSLPEPRRAAYDALDDWLSRTVLG